MGNRIQGDSNSFLPIESECVMESVEIVEADLDSADHQKAVLDLIDAYAMDPMGNGGPLPKHVKNVLIPGLKKHPTTLIFIAYAHHEAIGIAVCFIGFSTFAARPLINVHDLAVLPAYRRCGAGRMLLAAVERKARTLGCCKVTPGGARKQPPGHEGLPGGGLCSGHLYPRGRRGAILRQAPIVTNAGIGGFKDDRIQGPKPKAQVPNKFQWLESQIPSRLSEAFFEVLILLSVIFGESGIAVPATLI
jgi:GNAT superfamily N-acetyltransferase